MNIIGQKVQSINSERIGIITNITKSKIFISFVTGESIGIKFNRFEELLRSAPEVMQEVRKLMKKEVING